MSGLPFSWLKRVAGAVGGQAGVSRRVSGRGMGLQSSKLVAPCLLVCYSPLAINFCAPGSGAVSRCGAQLSQAYRCQ